MTNEIMPPCSTRLESSLSSGEILHVCYHPQAPSYKRKVTSECCTACPLRGTVPTATYRPLWPVCDKRAKEEKREPCGCLYQISLCQHPESPNNGKQVFPKDCRACPLAKPVG
jgi:hypothetical protein